MVKVSQPYGHAGVQLEIDGFVVPELTDVTIRCPVDDIVTVTAGVLATTPFEVAFSEKVTVVFQNVVLAEAARKVLNMIEADSDFHASSRPCRELKQLLEG